jgi:plastocyanin
MIPLRQTAISAVLITGLGIAAACSSEKGGTGPTGDCIAPTTSNFVDSAQGRVVIRNNTFNPSNIQVRDGMSVRWIYCEAANADPHTTTSDNGLWDSGLLQRGATYTRTFATIGAFPYHCIPHPEMQAVVTVVD